jgi:ribosome-associated protein
VVAAIEVELRDEAIRLGQLLQLAGLVGSGSEAKAVLAAGVVTVNGEAEARRGRQIRMGDVVEALGEQITVRAPC